MEYTYQFYTGGYGEIAAESFDTSSINDTIRDTIREIFGITGPGDVIIGWNSRSDSLYRDAIELVHSEGKRVWLWLPVFSELPAVEAADPAISYLGRPQQGVQIFEGEDFRFACPSSAHNRGIAFKLYEKHFSHLPFDGVFLDKIRHASFAGGLENGFGCFCGECKAAYARHGVDAVAIAAMIKEIFDGGSGGGDFDSVIGGGANAAFIPASMDNGVYHYENMAIDKFYQAKTKIITEAVANLSGRFRAIGMDVALDVFAPLLSYFVGQDIRALANHASFIKPMVYRITKAPAGLPFELSWLNQCICPGSHTAASLLERIWDCVDLCSEKCMEAQIGALSLSLDKLRPGFEINIVPGICESSPAYVASTKGLLERLGHTNAVLCWNMLAGTGNNLAALI